MRTVRSAMLTLVLLSTACCTEEVVSGDEFLGILHEDVTLLEGRPFSLTVLEVAAPPGSAPARVLSIAGDDRRISFHVAGAPGRPTVEGSTLRFGGHSLQVTGTPGVHLIDGAAVSLDAEPRRVHVFSDGVYRGARRF